MLMALDKNGNRIEAKDAVKGNLYYCPFCNEELVLKKGHVKIHHFAHQVSSTCKYKTNESQTHMAMKQMVRDIIERDNRCQQSELEWKLSSDDEYRIADYYCRIKDNDIAVECVVHNTDYEHFYQKTAFYYKNNIYPIWIFPMNRFKQHMRINEIMKSLHAMNYGKIWALDMDKQQICAVHFNPVYNYVEEYSYVDWDDLRSAYEATGTWQNPEDFEVSVGGYDKYLPYTKNPEFLSLSKFKLYSFQKRQANEYVDFDFSFASPFVKKFW